MAVEASLSSSSTLDGLRVLVAIASFDFMQIAHLEEVLDGFIDMCYAGSKVDLVIYTTVLVSKLLFICWYAYYGHGSFDSLLL